MNDRHGDLIDEIMKLINKDFSMKQLRNILVDYDVSICYWNNIILSLFVANRDFSGSRKCLKLGAHPYNIMFNDSIKTLDTLTKMKMDGVFLSFGYHCSWYDTDDNCINFDNYLN